MTRRIGISVVAFTLIAGPLASQEHQHEEGNAATGAQQMGMHCSMMGNMMAMMGMMGVEGESGMTTAMIFLSQNVLRHKDALRLTAAQLARIESLAEAQPGAHAMSGRRMENVPMMQGMQGMQGMQAQRQRMRVAFEATPVDEAAIRAAAGEMAAQHGAMMAEHLVKAAQVRDILTPAQRAQLVTLPATCMMDGASGQHSQPPTR